MPLKQLLHLRRCCWLLLTASLASAAVAQQPPQSYSQAQLQRAAQNIVRKVESGSKLPILVIASSTKKVLAQEIIKEAQRLNLRSELLLLAAESGNPQSIQQRATKAAPSSATIWLIDGADSELLFSAVGRPDLGIKIPTEHLFCDWLADLGTTIRTQAVDPEQTEAFRVKLAERLRGAKEITIATSAGTQISIRPRGWNTSPGDTNEVYSAPLEGVAEGQIVVDASVYWGPPAQPVVLKIKAGRIANLAELDKADKQQSLMLKDLTTDDSAAVLAEFGLGINTEANPLADLMEAEQARGTCHFGFGNNLEYGGANRSKKHVDYVLLRPTIFVDGTCICRDGVYLL